MIFIVLWICLKEADFFFGVGQHCHRRIQGEGGRRRGRGWLRGSRAPLPPSRLFEKQSSFRTVPSWYEIFLTLKLCLKPCEFMLKVKSKANLYQSLASTQVLSYSVVIKANSRTYQNPSATHVSQQSRRWLFRLSLTRFFKNLAARLCLNLSMRDLVL